VKEGRSRRTTLVYALVLGALGLLCPEASSGQVGNPTDVINNPHPTMPWTGITYPRRVNYGKVLRYFWVPPRRVAVDVTTSAVPTEGERRVVEIPGYYITETTTGLYYPARWTLIQRSVGRYWWQPLPPMFIRK